MQLSSAISSEVLHEHKPVTAPAANDPQWMNLRILRGPLNAWESHAILYHYNRLTSSQIPLEEYLHWVEDAPDGPAWHAILENESSEIVGHTAVIPMRGLRNGKKVVGGKAEYAFILEDYQTSKIRGFEKSGRPRNSIMIQQLFLQCQGEFDPLFISTSDVRRRSLSSVPSSNPTFAISECLLVTKPWRAARRTPNLRPWQRTTLGLIGVSQQFALIAGSLFPSQSSSIRSVCIHENVSNVESPSLRFFPDPESLQWRYPSAQYERLESEESQGYLILKKGSADRYLRICQWHLPAGQPSFSLLAKLVKVAKGQRALGVRWAVYGDDASSREIVQRMKRFGFLCARRTRTLLICSQDRHLLSSDGWSLTDSMFSFDP